MTNEEWCKIVLHKFFDKLVDAQTPFNPALSRVAGEIWNDWHSIQPFAQAVPKMPDYDRPGLLFPVQLVTTYAWKKFTADPYEVDWAVKARIERNFAYKVHAAISGERAD